MSAATRTAIPEQADDYPYKGLRWRGNDQTMFEVLDRGRVAEVSGDPWGWTAFPYNAHLGGAA